MRVNVCESQSSGSTLFILAAWRSVASVTHGYRQAGSMHRLRTALPNVTFDSHTLAHCDAGAEAIHHIRSAALDVSTNHSEITLRRRNPTANFLSSALLLSDAGDVGLGG